MILFLILILAGIGGQGFAQSPDSSDSALQPTAVAIPDGNGGIGFDDLVFSSESHQVLVPAGHTGKLYLIDPISFEMTSIGDFSSSAEPQKGHRVGISSADEGGGYIFTADHGKNELNAVDPRSGAVVAVANLAGESDYVRYVGFDHEVWVTEPHNKQIEVFSFSGGDQPKLRASASIPVHEGPESLVIDHRRGNAYTNAGTMAVAIDLESHRIVATWPNGCEKSRGDALDDQKGFLFVSCSEGKAVVFDLNDGHKEISKLTTDSGPDVISYNPKLSHLYVTSSQNATLSIIKVSVRGELSLLGQAQTDKRAHCVVGDDQNNIWVCDPSHGQLLRFKDTL